MNDNEGLKERALKGTPKKKFTPPSSSDVEEYMRFKGVPTDVALRESEMFVAHYGSKGWRVGKEGMQDWHKAVAGWITRGNLAPAKALTEKIVAKLDATMKKWFEGAKANSRAFKRDGEWWVRLTDQEKAKLAPKLRKLKDQSHIEYGENLVVRLDRIMEARGED